MQRRTLTSAILAVSFFSTGSAFLMATSVAQSATADPENFIQNLSDSIIAEVNADKDIQAGDVKRIRALVDAKMMAHFDFERMTGSAVGPAWRGATPDQRARMTVEFQTLMVRTYAGALAQVKDQTILVKRRAGDAELDTLVVRSEVRGKGAPIQLDYRVARAGDAWKIFDVNVAGIWLGPAYRAQFAGLINAGGIEMLIATLAAKNQSVTLK